MGDQTKEQALRELLRMVAETGYAFVPPTPETHRRVNARAEGKPATDLRDVFGWNRPFDATVTGEAIFDLLQQADALEQAGGLWKSRLRIATADRGHYLHSAFPTVAPDAVFFGPDTYRFIRAAAASLPTASYRRAVDLGCGSGAGGLELAGRFDIAELWLTDINPAALELATANAAYLGQRASFAQSDLFAALDGNFDLILANPPYIADARHRAYRDGGGALGMELSLRIVREGIRRLTPGGVMFLYTGVAIVDGADLFRAAAEQIVSPSRCSLHYDEIDPDVFGEELDQPAYRNVERIAAVKIVITRSRI